MTDDRLNVLLVGSGGREHALAWRLSASPRLKRLFAAPGNPGIAEHAALSALAIEDADAVVDFCRREAIDLVVIGPEAPLVAGLADCLVAAGIRVFGPSRAAAALEGSKGFTKDLCAEAGIPTAAYRRFTEAEAARAYVRERGAPIVIKADGIAAGKGVVVAATLEAALEAIDACFAGAFGAAGAEIVIEDLLVGEEASFFAIADGESVIAFGAAQDHKRAFDGDQGPNTGGMGAFSPAPIMDGAMIERTMIEIIRPTVAALARRGTPFKGVLFAGLMITEHGPQLIEYNVRFGDPECQVLMMRLESDLLELLLAAADGRLSAAALPRFSEGAALTVVMAANGYPGPYARGTPIGSLAAAAAIDGAKVFQAGTALDDGRLVAAGGRVLNVSAAGSSIAEAKARAYRAVEAIDWPDGFCRRDIGARAIEGG